MNRSTGLRCGETGVFGPSGCPSGTTVPDVTSAVARRTCSEPTVFNAPDSPSGPQRPQLPIVTSRSFPPPCAGQPRAVAVPLSCRSASASVAQRLSSRRDSLPVPVKGKLSTITTRAGTLYPAIRSLQ